MFKIGDIVTIVEKTEPSRWLQHWYWTSNMDKFIGHTGRVLDIFPENGGIVVEGTDRGYVYPIASIGNLDGEE